MQQNIIYHLDILLPTVVHRYCDLLGQRAFPELQILAKDYAYLKGEINSPSFSSSSQNSPIQQKASIEMLSNGEIISSSPVPAPRARRTQIQIKTNGSVNLAAVRSRDSSASPSNNSEKFSSTGTYL